jgi:hypothetical protein
MTLPVFGNWPRPRVEGPAREGGVLLALDPCDFLAQPRGIIERFSFVLQFDFRDSKPAVCAEIAADLPDVFCMLERVAVLFDDFAAGKIDKGQGLMQGEFLFELEPGDARPRQFNGESGVCKIADAHADAHMILRCEIDLPDMLPLQRIVAPRRIRDQKLALDFNWN